MFRHLLSPRFFSSYYDFYWLVVLSQEGGLAILYKQLPEISEFAEIISLELKDGNLVLNYLYHGRNSSYTPDVVKIIAIEQIGAPPITPQEKEIEQEVEQVTKKKGMKGKLKWMDAVEKFLDLGQAYVLIIERNIRLDIDCEQPRPQFNLKEQWAHIAVAAGGGIAIGLGQLYQNKKEKSYNRYKDIWETGESGTEAEADWNDAKKYEALSITLTYTGVGIIVLDAIWFFIHRNEVHRKQRLFDEFCLSNSNSTLIIHPSFSPQRLQISNFNTPFAINFSLQF